MPYHFMTLVTCPYCPGDEGKIILDPETCWYARSEDPDPRYLDRERMEDGQDLIAFVSHERGWRPCAHLLHAEGVIDWRLTPSEEDGDDEGSRNTWQITFQWVARSLLDRSLAHTAAWRNDYEKVRRLAPDLLPTTPFRWDHVSGTWDEMSWRQPYASIYTHDSRFLFAAKPSQFLKELSAKSYEYNARRMARKK